MIAAQIKADRKSKGSPLTWSTDSCRAKATLRHQLAGALGLTTACPTLNIIRTPSLLSGAVRQVEHRPLRPVRQSMNPPVLTAAYLVAGHPLPGPACVSGAFRGTGQ